MNSKLELRLEAVRLAVNTEGVTVENVIAASEKIAEFILGGSELPDTYDTNFYIKEMMARMPQPTDYASRLDKDMAGIGDELKKKLAELNDEKADEEAAEA